MSGARRQTIALTLVGALAVALGGFSVRAADAASPAPAQIVLDSVSSGIAAPPGTAPKSLPRVLALAGAPLAVTVSFLDASGQPASFNKDTRISVTAAGTTVRSIDTLALKGETTSTLSIAIPDGASRVALKVAFTSGRLTYSDTATTEPDQRFDVVSELETDTAPSAGSFAPGIGGTNDCAEATRSDPVCGIFVLPQAAQGQQVLLSRAPCDAVTYTGCTKGSVVQALADLSGYSTTSPATFIVKCDKSLCGKGPIQGQVVNWAIDGDAPLRQALACPAKGTVAAPGTACVDYVQSKRDGSGDTYFYVLFPDDARVSIG